MLLSSPLLEHELNLSSTSKKFQENPSLFTNSTDFLLDDQAEPHASPIALQRAATAIKNIDFSCGPINGIVSDISENDQVSAESVSDEFTNIPRSCGPLNHLFDHSPNSPIKSVSTANITGDFKSTVPLVACENLLLPKAYVAFPSSSFRTKEHNEFYTHNNSNNNTVPNYSSVFHKNSLQSNSSDFVKNDHKITVKSPEQVPTSSIFAMILTQNNPFLTPPLRSRKSSLSLLDIDNDFLSLPSPQVHLTDKNHSSDLDEESDRPRNFNIASDLSEVGVSYGFYSPNIAMLSSPCLDSLNDTNKQKTPQLIFRDENENIGSVTEKKIDPYNPSINPQTQPFHRISVGTLSERLLEIIHRRQQSDCENDVGINSDVTSSSFVREAVTALELCASGIRFNRRYFASELHSACRRLRSVAIQHKLRRRRRSQYSDDDDELEISKMQPLLYPLSISTSSCVDLPDSGKTVLNQCHQTVSKKSNPSLILNSDDFEVITSLLEYTESILTSSYNQNAQSSISNNNSPTSISVDIKSDRRRGSDLTGGTGYNFDEVDSIGRLIPAQNCLVADKILSGFLESLTASTDNISDQITSGSVKSEFPAIPKNSSSLSNVNKDHSQDENEFNNDNAVRFAKVILSSYKVCKTVGLSFPQIAGFDCYEYQQPIIKETSDKNPPISIKPEIPITGVGDFSESYGASDSVQLCEANTNEKRSKPSTRRQHGGKHHLDYFLEETVAEDDDEPKLFVNHPVKTNRQEQNSRNPTKSRRFLGQYTASPLKHQHHQVNYQSVSNYGNNYLFPLAGNIQKRSIIQQQQVQNLPVHVLERIRRSQIARDGHRTVLDAQKSVLGIFSGQTNNNSIKSEGQVAQNNDYSSPSQYNYHQKFGSTPQLNMKHDSSAVKLESYHGITPCTSSFVKLEPILGVDHLRTNCIGDGVTIKLEQDQQNSICHSTTFQSYCPIKQFSPPLPPPLCPPVCDNVNLFRNKNAQIPTHLINQSRQYNNQLHQPLIGSFPPRSMTYSRHII